MNDEQHKDFLVEYPFNGAQWSMTISAASFEEAQARLRAMGWAKVKGEVKATIPVPRWLFQQFWK